jgi:hypothetical protein
MKQENRFVAQLFHYLAPFVNMGRDFFICVDGGAAKHHAGLKGARLTDPNVPDLWFSFCGQHDYIGIEAKILEKNSISIRKGQLRAWRTSGTGIYRPKFWVATNRDVTEFFCWHHSTMLPRLDSTSSRVDNVSLSLSKYPPDHQSGNIAELALFILTHRLVL